ncbi:MgtC/SapB family protein [Rhodococcus sp. NPDC056960]|uniref:MgtC/SapB family protein n=1 Tax=Rhodococcus sp. NPDC056960 TaxID=3345982 RepID=UPI00362DD826
MDISEFHAYGYSAALLIGLGLGIEREHAARTPPGDDAGLWEWPGARTFPLIALAGAVAAHLGTAVVTAAFVGIAALILGWYWVRTHLPPRPDVGTTTAFAALVAFLLGALAWHYPSLAVALGVVVLVLLAVKYPMHEFAERMIDERDITDFCVLLAIAFLVLPLLPDRAVGPYGALNPAMIGRLVLMLSLIGWVGYVATRILGPRWGLLIVGFGGGFVSGAATTAVMARTARREQDSPDALPAALIVNLSTILLVVVITWVVNAEVSAQLALIFGGAAALVVAETAVLVLRGPHDRMPGSRTPKAQPSTGLLDRPISVPATLSLAGILLVLLLMTKGAADIFGGGGVIAASAVGGFADAHSASLAAASAAGDAITVDTATAAAVVAVGTNLLTKLVLAALAGSFRFALMLSLLLAAPVVATVLTLWAMAFG